MSRITQETRRESYHEIRRLSSERHLQCLHGLNELGGSATANELAKYLWESGLTPFFNRNFVHPRLNELVGKGVIEVTGKKKDDQTNRSVAIYRIKEAM